MGKNRVQVIDFVQADRISDVLTYSINAFLRYLLKTGNALKSGNDHISAEMIFLTLFYIWPLLLDMSNSSMRIREIISYTTTQITSFLICLLISKKYMHIWRYSKCLKI